jgi:predicted acylesterase/phospholipase RssA
MRRGLAVYGGGNYIFYIAGVLSRLLERGLQFEAVASYSAGAALMPAIVSGRVDEAVTSFCNLLRADIPGEPAAGWWERAFSRDSTYSHMLRQHYDFDAMRASGKDVRVIVATYQNELLCGRAVALLGLIALAFYNRSKRFAGASALELFKKYADLRAEVIDMRACVTRDEAIQIVQGSSTIYPFIKVRSRDGRRMLDGKFALLSPIATLSDCDRIVSVHGSYTFPVEKANLLQIGPRRPLEIKSFEPIDQERVERLFDRGTEDANFHFEKLDAIGFFSAAA